MKYTSTELMYDLEAKNMPQRILIATWITGKGPRGGKVSIGKGRYDDFNIMVIENKAEVIGRFTTPQFYAGLMVVGVIVRMNRVRIT